MLCTQKCRHTHSLSLSLKTQKCTHKKTREKKRGSKEILMTISRKNTVVKNVLDQPQKTGLNISLTIRRNCVLIWSLNLSLYNVK